VTRLTIRAHGKTHTGNVREANEDSLLMDPKLGLYGVLDGMGGHSAGDVASQRARDAIHEYVAARHQSMAPRDLLTAALNAASAAVHSEAKRRRDRQGMGTTAVVCLVIDDKHVVIAHVGDSRAYMLRDRRLHQLTEDHTVVAELIANGAISAEEALHHPYKSVLSRNLGAKPATKVDLTEVTLQPGERIMLCSDGLNGYASAEAVEQIVAGSEDAEQSTVDLIEIALRGGGGDNVSVVVLEAGKQVVPRSTLIIQTTGADAWWRRRSLFMGACRERGLARSPICAVLSPEEALEIVAGNLCEAIYHDLEQNSGINVWTYAENLAKGWFDQGGDFRPLRDMLDLLGSAAAAVIADIASGGQQFSVALEISITRSLTTIEMVVGGLLAERLRGIEAALVKLHARAPTQQPVTDHPTIPYMQAVSIEAPAPNVAACIDQAIPLALVSVQDQGEKAGARECLEYAANSSFDATHGNDAVLAARELFGMRALEEAGIGPLLDAADQARRAHIEALNQLDHPAKVRAGAVRLVALAHKRLFLAISQLVVDAGAPISDELHRASERTSQLRQQVAQGERKLAKMEKKFVTLVDREPTDISGTSRHK